VIANGQTFYWVRPYPGPHKFRIDTIFCGRSDDGRVWGRPAILGPGGPTALYDPQECEDAEGKPLFPEEAHVPEAAGD